jgi:hypothetical protein
MPTFLITGPGFDERPFEAEDWMSAVQVALDVIAERTHLQDLDVEITPDGDILVLCGDVRFTVRERGRTLGSRLRGLPESPPVLAAALDAPEPGVLPAWESREEWGDATLDRLPEELAVLDGLGGAEAADRALALLMRAVPAESGAVLLLDGENLRFVAAQGPRAGAVRGTAIPAVLGIAGLVTARGIAVTVREAEQDPHHYDAVDRESGYHTHAVLCVPLRKGGAAVGCVELLNPFGDADFAGWHLNATQLVAGRLAARL